MERGPARGRLGAESQGQRDSPQRRHRAFSTIHPFWDDGAGVAA